MQTQLEAKLKTVKKTRNSTQRKTHSRSVISFENQSNETYLNEENKNLSVATHEN